MFCKINLPTISNYLSKVLASLKLNNVVVAFAELQEHAALVIPSLETGLSVLLVDIKNLSKRPTYAMSVLWHEIGHLVLDHGLLTDRVTAEYEATMFALDHFDSLNDTKNYSACLRWVDLEWRECSDPYPKARKLIFKEVSND